MDWYPLLNSLRIAAISAVVVFFAGIAAAYYIAKLPRLVKGVLDVILTLPLVLPPTVVGYLLLRVLGPKRVIGAWVLETFGIRLVMTWWSAIFATVVVVFPLMYRTVRGAFEAFDETLAYPERGEAYRLPQFPAGTSLPARRVPRWLEYHPTVVCGSDSGHGGGSGQCGLPCGRGVYCLRQPCDTGFERCGGAASPGGGHRRAAAARTRSGGDASRGRDERQL